MELGTASSATAPAEILQKARRVDNFLPKSEDGVSLVAMPDRTLAMSTAMILDLPSLFRPASRFSVVDLRIDNGRALRRLPGERAPQKIKLARGRV